VSVAPVLVCEVTSRFGLAAETGGAERNARDQTNIAVAIAIANGLPPLAEPIPGLNSKVPKNRQKGL